MTGAKNWSRASCLHGPVSERKHGRWCLRIRGDSRVKGRFLHLWQVREKERCRTNLMRGPTRLGQQSLSEPGRTEERSRLPPRWQGVLGSSESGRM